MALVCYEVSCAACGAKATDAQSWGRVLKGEGGGEDRPIGNACGRCLEVAGARWPMKRWEDLIENSETRSRIAHMAAVRSGSVPTDFIPKTVESKVEISVRWVNVQKPMSIPEFQSECTTKHHPRDLGVAVCSRPGRSGAMEECVLVRAPNESRLEIVMSETVETTEALLVGADNLEESHADAIADIVKRQLLRKFTSDAPTLEELRDQVREQPGDRSSGASEPVATGAVRVGGGRECSSPDKVGLAGTGHGPAQPSIQAHSQLCRPAQAQPAIQAEKGSSCAWRHAASLGTERGR